MLGNMRDDYHQLGQAELEIEKTQAEIRSLRAQERKIQAAENRLKYAPPSQRGDAAKNLLRHIQKALPAAMRPSNVGALHAVQWPFWHAFEFDFGTDPVLSAATRQTQSFQITQEAGILAMAISWSPDSYTTSGFLGPWFLEIRDRQSSRQFNDAVLPLQMIGARGNPSILPVPLYLMPNAFLDATITTRQPTGVATQATTGSGAHEIVMFGYKTRDKDVGKILSTIYK